MDPTIAPFLRVPTKEQHERDTPHVNLELVPVAFTKDTDCLILLRFTRSPDNHNKPCIFHFHSFYDAFGPSGFLLFRHTAHGLSQVMLSGLPAVQPESEPRRAIDGWPSDVRELAPDGQVQIMTTLPKRYRREMEEGMKYELVWPGSEVALWDCGTVKEHIGILLGAKSSAIWVPPAQITLEIGEEREPEREVSPPLVEDSERIPGAPKVNVTLECEEKSIATSGTAHIKISVKYEADPGSRPITFHSHPFLAWGYQLYRRVEDGSWESIEDDTTGFMILDDPDLTVNVTRDENFATLNPGQTWTTHHDLKGGGFDGMPSALTIGEVYRYRFKGLKLDWWDWGGKEEHEQTYVDLPCFKKGVVQKPRDNDGRPELVVPASNILEFSIN